MQVNVLSYQIKELFEKSKQVLIVLGEGADLDQASLAAALVEIFESYNKKATLLSKVTLPAAAQPLVKSEKIKSALAPKSLVLSFDWNKSQLDRVSYKMEGNRFNLIISSKGKRIRPEEITYSYQGEDYDFVITVGVKNLGELNPFGLEAENFNRLPSLNLDKKIENTSFAKLNLVNATTDSLSGTGANLFKEAGIKLPTRAAEAMLFGIRSVTNNFASVSDPSTFEAAAYCKRAMIPSFGGDEGKTKPNTEIRSEENENQTPEGWLSPKIFRSSKFS